MMSRDTLEHEPDMAVIGATKRQLADCWNALNLPPRPPERVEESLFCGEAEIVGLIDCINNLPLALRPYVDVFVTKENRTYSGLQLGGLHRDHTHEVVQVYATFAMVGHRFFEREACYTFNLSDACFVKLVGFTDGRDSPYKEIARFSDCCGQPSEASREGRGQRKVRGDH